MSAFAGIVTFDGAADRGSIENRIGRALAGPRSERLATGALAGALFGQRAAANTALNERRPFVDPAGRTLSVASARLDNRDEIGAILNFAPAQLARLSDSALVWRAFESRGEAGLARCLGAFAFVAWDAGTRRLTLARDCLGNRSLFFYRDRGYVAFASTLQALLALPDVPRELDEIVLANYLALNLGEVRRTFYRGIERVPSRTVVTIDDRGIRDRHYWSPALDAAPYRSEDEYVERARELLDQAVAAATADTSQIAVSCSGGLDSSAVAATAARLGRAVSIACYTLVPPAGVRIDPGPFNYWDERDKVEALARMHAGLDMRLIAPERPHPYEEDSTRYFVRTDLPVLNPANLGWFSALYERAAADGHSVLLTGQRGNFGLSWRGKFSLQTLLRAGHWTAFAKEWRAVARETERGMARTFVSEVVVPGGPTWLRRSLYRMVKGDPDSVAFYSALNPEFIAEHGLIDRWRAQGFEEPWFRGTGWNSSEFRARKLFDHNQFARDTVALRAEQHTLELRDPHSDRRLLEFALSVPEWLYRQNGVGRSFARRVLADRLPREILNERQSGVQAGAWFSRLTMRRHDIAEEIERLGASPLASRLLDLPRLRGLLDEWPKDEQAAAPRKFEFHLALDRGLHVGRFIRWVEGGNA